MKVPIVENVLKLNDEIAAINRQALHDAGVFSINLIGAPGCGKTSLIEATVRRLKDTVRFGMVVGDLATDRDGQRLTHAAGQVVQINTGKGCHLDANQLRQAMTNFDLTTLDVLLVENVGNLICPVGFDLGQDVKLGMFSVSEGDDKAAKHPYLVHEAAMLLLNKIDLLPHVPFDVELFRADVHRINPQVRLIETSVVSQRMSIWLDWLMDAIVHADKTRNYPAA